MKYLKSVFLNARFLVLVNFLFCASACGASSDAESAKASQVELEDRIESLEVRAGVFPEPIKDILQNNLNYFRDGVGVEPVSGFPYGNIDVDPQTDEIIDRRDYVKTTYISTYLTILLEMSKVEGESSVLAQKRIRKILQRLFTLNHWNGMLHGGHYISKGFENGKGKVTAPNNSKLVFTLMAIAGAYMDSDEPLKQEIAELAERFLERQKPGWSQLYDAEEGVMRKTWDTEKLEFKGRITGFVEEAMPGAIAGILLTSDMGSDAIPETAFTSLDFDVVDYTLSSGETVTSLQSGSGAFYFPTVPMIWLDQRQYMGDSFQYFKNFAAVHNDFRKAQNLPLMLSACTALDGGYYNAGVPALSNKKEQTPFDLATPRTIGLAYMIDPQVAIEMALDTKQRFPNIETPYGWYDSINAEGQTSYKIKTLGQGLMIGGFLADETYKDIKKYFDRKGYAEILDRLYMPHNSGDPVYRYAAGF